MKATLAFRVSVPKVPVTVTVTAPTVLKVHDRVEDPDPVTEVGDIEQAALSADRPTFEPNPFCEPTVIVEVPAIPTSTWTLDEPALTVKSCTW